MFLTILYRMILWELVKVFALSLVAITGLLLLAGIIAEASQRGLGPEQLLFVIPLLIPNTLPYTLPATTLFATCVIYGRLAADNEILAIKAAGINILQVVRPAVFLGLLASVATFALYYQLIPQTHHTLRSRIMSDMEEYLYGMLKQTGCIKHAKLNYVIFVKRVEGKKLIDAQFMRRDAKGQHYDIIARAQEAELRVNLPKNKILVDMRRCYIAASESGKGQAYFESKVWEVDFPDLSPSEKMRPSDMTWPEMEEGRQKYEEAIREKQVDIDLHQAKIDEGTAPKNFARHIADLKNQQREMQKYIRSIDVEMHMRPALALGCLCFVMVGCPVGIWFSRSDYLSAFITCFLPIIFLYYPILLCGVNMAKTGNLPPGWPLWTADCLMGATAFYLFRRLLRH